MKLLALHLLAYGAFTDTSVVLDAETDLHVLFGGNEAGKTTALRALTALLYGVPETTRDHFLHPRPALRVGGHLQHSDGSELELVRRKGRKGTVLSTEGETLDDAMLDRFLTGVDRTRFRTVFGIDHQRLEQGAQEILRGGGDVGQSLFAVGLGTASLREVMASLEAEADKLFRPRGSTQAINKEIAGYKKAHKRVRELSQSSRAWSTQRRQLEQLEGERDALVTERAALSREHSRLSRLHQALPRLGQRRELLVDLEPLDDVTLPGEDFSTRRQQAVRTLEEARKTRHRARSELARRRDRAQRLAVPTELLAAEGAVDALYKELGTHQKGASDSEKLRGRKDALRTDAHALLDGLRPDVPLDEVEPLRPLTSTKARVRKLAERHEANVEASERARRDVAKTERELVETQEKLAAAGEVREVGGLRAVVARQRRRGDVEEARQELLGELGTAREEARIALEALGLWQGTLDEAERLAVPSVETVGRFDEDLRSIDDEDARLAERIDTRRREVGDQDEGLESLRLAGEVLTEADLDHARRRRAEGWQLVRRAWLDGEDVVDEARVYDPERELPAAYQHHVEAADEVADRLRREADLVARHATLTARRTRLVGEIVALGSDREQLAVRRGALLDAWRALWSPLGIDPSTPREMRAWLTRHQSVKDRAGAVRELGRRTASSEEGLAALRGQLAAALEQAGEPTLDPAETLASGLDRAQDAVEAMERLAQRQEQLRQQVSRLETSLEESRQELAEKRRALEEWEAEWGQAVAVIGLPSSALPAEANAVLDKLDELFDKVDSVRGLTSRLAGIERDARAFEGAIGELVCQVAPDLVDQPPERALEALKDRLTRARKDAAEREQLVQRIEELDEEEATATEDIALAGGQLDALCAQVGVRRHEELEAAEQRIDLKRRLQSELLALDARLVDLGGGATVDELIAEAEEVDPDVLPAQLAEIERDLAALDDQRTGLDRQIGSEGAELRRVDGSEEAAAEEFRAQGHLARIRTDVERYVRVRLASELLRREIERYREANQGPLLTRAAELFNTLTLGSFSGLRSDRDDRDQPLLHGVRPSGEQVTVDGMSDGTRDQLYLAIRLATLEQYLAAHEPVPFVVDDILIRFDDDRARAALRVLAELSRHTQVLFFTHHARLVDLARDLGPGVAAVYDLSGREEGAGPPEG